MGYIYFIFLLLIRFFNFSTEAGVSVSKPIIGKKQLKTSKAQTTEGKGFWINIKHLDLPKSIF